MEGRQGGAAAVCSLASWLPGGPRNPENRGTRTHHLRPPRSSPSAVPDAYCTRRPRPAAGYDGQLAAGRACLPRRPAAPPPNAAARTRPRRMSHPALPALPYTAQPASLRLPTRQRSAPRTALERARSEPRTQARPRARAAKGCSTTPGPVKPPHASAEAARGGPRHRARDAARAQRRTWHRSHRAPCPPLRAPAGQHELHRHERVAEPPGRAVGHQRGEARRDSRVHPRQAPLDRWCARTCACLCLRAAPLAAACCALLHSCCLTPAAARLSEDR